MGGRELPPADDIGIVWWGHGGDLAARMLALADELDLKGHIKAADDIRAVLTTEYNPLPDQLPKLGDPPKPRPADAMTVLDVLPRNYRPGTEMASEPGS